MKTFQATCDQSNRERFGARAGNQCVCNSAMFIHAAHLLGLSPSSPLLAQEALDAVLQEGARLDARLEKDLQKKQPGKKLPVYRMGDEVPRRIDSSFGSTVHALSRPFNGTTETQDLGGYQCLGIFDFLRYAYAKQRPVYMLIIVNSLARAVIITPQDLIFVFDPHRTSQCSNAAAYQCESLHEVVMLLTSFGAALSNFYYDALFLYMLDLSSGPALPEAQINSLIVTTYRDRDLDLPVPTSLTGPASLTTVAASVLPALPAPPQVCPASDIPPGTDRPLPIPPDDALPLAPLVPPPKKTPEKRRKEPGESKHGGKKKPAAPTTPTSGQAPSALATTATPYSCAGALPALQQYQQMVSQMEQQLRGLTIDAPPQTSWTLYSSSPSADSGSGTAGTGGAATFDESFLGDRVQQLLIHAINHLSCLESDCDPTSTAAQTVSSFYGFNTGINAFLSNWAHHGLNLRKMHDYLQHKKSISSVLDRALIDKMLKVFEPWAQRHGAALVTWVDELMRQVERTQLSDLQRRLEKYRTRNPVPVNQSFVCLRPSDFKKITQTIGTRQESIQRQREKSQNLYNQLAGMLISIDIHDIGSTEINKREVSKALTQVDEAARRELQQLGTHKMLELQQDVNRLSVELLARRHNQILAGFLPLEELQALERTIDQVLEVLNDLTVLGLCEPGLEAGFQNVKDQFSYLMTGNAVNEYSLLEEITRLRQQYLLATQQREDVLIQVQDLIFSLENLVKDPSPQRGSQTTLAMVHEQMSQLQALGALDMPEVRARLQNVERGLNKLYEEEDETREYLRTLSYDNPPTDQGLKRYGRLKAMLRDDADARLLLLNTILRIFDDMVKRLARDDTLRPQVFDAVNSLINHLPPGSEEMENLRAANAIYSQLSKKMDAVAKTPAGAAPGDPKRLQTLKELTYFFMSNDQFFTHMLKLNVGADVRELYERYKRELEQLHVERLEKEWQEEAEKLPVTSHDDVRRFLDRAPSTRILARVQPRLMTRLHEFLDKENRRQEEERRRQLDEYRQMAQADLARAVESVRNDTLSTVPGMRLEETQEILAGLDPRAQEELLRKFNHDMLGALSQLRKTLDDRISQCMQDVLSGETARRRSYAEHATQTRASLTHLRRVMGPRLMQETQRTLDEVTRQATFIERCQLGDAETVFTGTDYEQDYARYRQGQQQLQQQLNTAREELTRASQDLENAIRDPKQLPGPGKKDSGAAAALAGKKGIDARTLTGRITPPPDNFGRPLFKTMLDKQAETAKKALQDETELMNQKLQSTVKLREEYVTSLQNQWAELVTRMKMEWLDVATPDTKSLLENPVWALTEMLGKTVPTMPYVAAERALRWAALFIQEAVKQISGDPSHPQRAQQQMYETLQQRTAQSLDTVTRNVNVNAACENFVSQQQQEGGGLAGTADPEVIQAVEAAWQQLDPARVAGGEQRHQRVRETLHRLSQSLTELELQDALVSEYLQLLHNIQTFSYGLDFKAQLDKIADLKTRFTDLARQRNVRLSSDAPLPDPRDPNVGASHLSTFVRGLQALERHVLSALTYLTEQVNQCPAIVPRLDDIPRVMPPAQTDGSLVTQDRLKRMCFSRRDDLFIQVLDVFGTEQLVTPKGESIQFTAGYGNVVFKYLALRQDERSLARKCSGLKNVVSVKYKAVTVSVAIAQTLKAFWPQITRYDLKPYFSQQQQQQRAAQDGGSVPLGPAQPPEANTLLNLKLFCYVVLMAWDQQIDPWQEGGQGGQPLRLTPDEFCIVMTTFSPEYIYTIMKYPLQMSLASLTTGIQRDIVNNALSNTSMPPDYSGDQVKGFAFDRTLWPQVSLSKLFWDSEIMRQLCQAAGPAGQSRQHAGKLLMYALCTLVFPQDMLHCLWLELKPKYAEVYASVQELVQVLFKIFSQQCRLLNEANTQTQLPTGERVLQSIRVQRQEREKNDTDSGWGGTGGDDSDLLETFINTETALDMALGSWLFGIPVCIGVYVTDLAKGQRVLVTRHIEYTNNDPDFKNIQRIKDLNLNPLVSKTWTETPYEQCWYQAQVLRLRQYLRHPVRFVYTPLVVYTPQERYVHLAVRPPTPGQRHEIPRLTVENPFVPYPLDEDSYPADGAPLPALPPLSSSSSSSASGPAATAPPAPLNRVPVSIDFLRQNPPPLTRPPRPAWRHRHRTAAAAANYQQQLPESSVDPEDYGTSAFFDSALSTQTFNDPIFQPQSVEEAAMCRDELMTVAPSAARTDFITPPLTVLTQNILSALEILRAVRIDLRALAQSVNETLNRLRFLYLL
ncbi:large tegument protein [Panine betaherpesvirus 2]|uniref:Large tegument protein n=1 Tax=Panine betaherpesvirus 2 TaxID=188763 RepID=Q8QS41_9BETA|nr:large tegument protein [Panine betaherpesvirus 2]AAM00697.1 large tegument protein [Panine betaherpesvirus 2]QXV67802.1 large tegument protein [Panine betaherpesvirus 2]